MVQNPIKIKNKRFFKIKVSLSGRIHKSVIFQRIVGENISIKLPVPGTSRDNSTGWLVNAFTAFISGTFFDPIGYGQFYNQRSELWLADTNNTLLWLVRHRRFRSVNSELGLVKTCETVSSLVARAAWFLQHSNYITKLSWTVRLAVAVTSCPECKFQLSSWFFTFVKLSDKIFYLLFIYHPYILGLTIIIPGK